MPVRERTVESLVQNVIGHQQWDGRIGEVVTMPQHDYDELREAMDDLFVRFVQEINWNRVELEAYGRCLRLEHVHELNETICGESIQHALLACERGGWRKDSDDESGCLDWPVRVADALQYRRSHHAGFKDHLDRVY